MGNYSNFFSIFHKWDNCGYSMKWRILGFDLKELNKTINISVSCTKEKINNYHCQRYFSLVKIIITTFQMLLILLFTFNYFVFLLNCKWQKQMFSLSLFSIILIQVIVISKVVQFHYFCYYYIVWTPSFHELLLQ